jgi:DegV family protein with EDD domain
MSGEYVIFSDASADLDKKTLAKDGITLIPMQFMLGKDTYLRYGDDRGISPADVFTRLAQGERGGTSHITVAAFLAILRPYLEEGKDLFIITLSSGISRNFSKAFVALNQLINEYPDRQMKVLDSFTGGAGLDGLLEAVSENQRKGMTLEENYAKSYALVEKIRTWILLDDPKMVKSSSLLALPQNFIIRNLRRKPLLHLDDCGHIAGTEAAVDRRKGSELLFLHVATLPDRNAILYTRSQRERSR